MHQVNQGEESHMVRHMLQPLMCLVAAHILKDTQCQNRKKSTVQIKNIIKRKLLEIKYTEKKRHVDLVISRTDFGALERIC